MPRLRVTKYDPARRGANGAYLVDEWTAVSDVGRSYGGKTVTWSDYLRVEDAYVESVHRFLSSWGISTLRVVDLERNRAERHLCPEATLGVEPRLRVVRDGAWVSGEDLDWVVRLVLREMIWCRLVGERGVYVQFGDDYYMYVGAEEVSPDAPPLPGGMFAEECFAEERGGADE